MFQESVQLCGGVRSVNRSLVIEPTTEAECFTHFMPITEVWGGKILDLFLDMYFMVRWLQTSYATKLNFWSDHLLVSYVTLLQVIFHYLHV